MTLEVIVRTLSPFPFIQLALPRPGFEPGLSLSSLHVFTFLQLPGTSGTNSYNDKDHRKGLLDNLFKMFDQGLQLHQNLKPIGLLFGIYHGYHTNLFKMFDQGLQLHQNLKPI